MGTIALNKLLNLHLDWWDLHFLYSVVPTADNSYYFMARNPEQKLITDLPNSSKGEGDDYLVVIGNWKPRDAEGNTVCFGCPTVVGQPRQYSISAYFLIFCTHSSIFFPTNCFFLCLFFYLQRAI
jgi:hypothetical protein